MTEMHVSSAERNLRRLLRLLFPAERPRRLSARWMTATFREIIGRDVLARAARSSAMRLWWDNC